MDATKDLFIISPIGPRNSETRVHFDKVRKHIIDPVAREKGYRTTRSDDIAKPGRITSQIIDRLKNDSLVVADLSRKNPNVYYELAIRHAVQKPVILIGESELDIPFDLAAQRVIPYSLDPDDIIEAKRQLLSQIEAVESDNFIFDSPVTDTIDIATQHTASDEQISQRILAILETQSKDIRDLLSNISPYEVGFTRTTYLPDYMRLNTEQANNILKMFIERKDKSFTVSEISLITGYPQHQVSVYLDQLVRTNTLIKKVTGIDVFYSLRQI